MRNIVILVANHRRFRFWISPEPLVANRAYEGLWVREYDRAVNYCHSICTNFEKVREQNQVLRRLNHITQRVTVCP